jgi:hypothetical protein
MPVSSCLGPLIVVRLQIIDSGRLKRAEEWTYQALSERFALPRYTHPVFDWVCWVVSTGEAYLTNSSYATKKK